MVTWLEPSLSLAPRERTRGSRGTTYVDRGCRGCVEQRTSSRGTHTALDTPHGRAHVKVHMCLRHKTRKDTCKLVHRLPYANSNTSHEKGAIEMKGCRTTRYLCASKHAGDNNGQTKHRVLVLMPATPTCLRARRGSLLWDAFGDAGTAVLELHGRVQRCLECRPTLEGACVGRSYSRGLEAGVAAHGHGGAAHLLAPLRSTLLGGRSTAAWEWWSAAVPADTRGRTSLASPEWLARLRVLACSGYIAGWAGL